MNLQTLTSWALWHANQGTAGVVSRGHLDFVTHLLRRPKESKPLHTLGLSLARALVYGEYTCESSLNHLGDDFSLDAEGYVHYYGIRLVHRDVLGFKLYPDIDRLRDTINTFLSNGVPVCARTVKKGHLLTADSKSPWLPAAISCWRILAKDGSDDIAVIFERENLPARWPFVVSVEAGNQHVWLNPVTTELALGELLSQGYKVIDAPETHEQFCAIMTHLGIDVATLKGLTEIDYLD